jgi:glycosyltransferase involved in cell wall biosynthesis
VTVHDVFAWSLPGTSTKADALLYRVWLPIVIARVDRVITISETSRADIIRFLHVSPERIRIVHRCPNTAYSPQDSGRTDSMRSRHGLPPRYLLFVGSVEKRKNLSRLLRACDILWRGGEKRPLVIAGARRWMYSDIMRTVEELGLHDRTIFTGFIPEEDLPALYRGADLFVFPSLYEGFGLPPLEAMACGTPVVCSNAASLPEVVGDAAVMVDPYDVEGLADAIHRVLGDAGLRAEMREKGLARASQFTWERAARETIQVYREVLKQ